MDVLDVLTLDEARQAINVTASTDHDADLAVMVTAVSRVLDAECGCVVERAVSGEVHDGSSGAVVTGLWPVSQFTTVTPTTVYDAEPFDRGAGLFSGRIEGAFPTTRWGVTVDYIAGRYPDTATVDARWKTVAASILRRLWKREAGTWAQSADFLETFDNQAQQSGFYRVAKPIIDELLADEQDRYSYARHYGFA